MSVTRSYHSPLRAEQMDQTRERLLGAALRLVPQPGVELTVAEVAKAAGVSVRTAYRYFPTREALLDAFNAWCAEHMGRIRLPATLDELPAMIERLFRNYEDNRALMEATRYTKVGVELRLRRKRDQVRAMERLFAPLTAGLGEVEARRAVSQVHSLISFDAYANMRDAWDLSCDDAVAATLRAVEQLLAPLRARSKKKGER